MTFLRLVSKKKTNEDINNSSPDQAKIISKDVHNYPEVRQVTLLQTFEGIIEQHRSLFASLQGIEVHETKQKANEEDKEKDLKNKKRVKSSSKQNKNEHSEDAIPEPRKSTGAGKSTKTGSSKSREGRVAQYDERKKEKTNKKEVDRKSPIQRNDSEKKVENDLILGNSLHSTDFTKASSSGKSNRLNLEKVNSLSCSNPRAKFRKRTSSRSLESKQSSCGGSSENCLDDIAKYGYENVSIRNLYGPSRSENDLDDISKYGYENVSIGDLDASCITTVPVETPKEVVQRKVGRRPSLTAKIVAEWNLHEEKTKSDENEQPSQPQSKKGKSTKARDQKEDNTLNPRLNQAKDCVSTSGQKAFQNNSNKVFSMSRNEDNILRPDNGLKEDFLQRISFTDVCGERLDSHALQYNRRSDPMFCTNEENSSDFTIEKDQEDSIVDTPRKTPRRRTSLSGSSLAPAATAAQRKLTGRNQNVIHRAAVRRNSLGRSQPNAIDNEETNCFPDNNEVYEVIAEAPKGRTQKMVRRASLR